MLRSYNKTKPGTGPKPPQIPMMEIEDEDMGNPDLLM